MKKTLLLIPSLILLALSISSCGSSVERTLESGNKSFYEQAYDQALMNYSQVMEMAPTLAEPVYNLANTLYRMEVFDQTAEMMVQALELASDELAQYGFYNLGNSLFQQQQMEGAIESYKEALRLNPDDMDAKYNLELAMQQQQQEQEQQQDQNQSGEDQQEQVSTGEAQSDQNQEDQQDPNQDGNENQNDQAQAGGETQESDQSGDLSSEQQEQNAHSQPQQLEGLTEEQARQILAAIGQTTKTLQEKLQEVFGVPVVPSGKDW